MTTFLAALLFVGSMVGGGFLTFIFLHLMVPPVVRAVGEEKFVEMSGLEPFSIVLFSGIAGGVLYTFASQKWGALPALLLFSVMSLLCVIYAIVWLKLAATGQGKKEFQVRAGQVVRLNDSQVLAPSCVQQQSDFHQTDAFHSYSFYHLILCDENGPMARNGYPDEEEMRAALREVLECSRAVPCRALDLILVRRQTETLWWKVNLGQENALLLCGSLSQLPEASRLWWHRWLRPEFPEDGFAEVPALELEHHFVALKTAYPALISDDARLQTAPEELETQMASLNRKEDWNQLVELSREYGKVRENDWIRVEMLLRRNDAPIQLMTQQRFEVEVKKVAPNGAMLMYGEVDGHTNLLSVEIQAR
jgi:hypothetical protein